MEYAIQLILPIIGGLMLGDWLSKTYGISPIWTVLLGILGMVMGIRILYKRGMSEQAVRQEQHPPQKKAPKTNTKTTPPTSNPGTPNPPSSRPTKAGTTLDALHDLYQQVEQHPPEETDDFPTDLDKELNRDDATDHPKPPQSGP